MLPVVYVCCVPHTCLNNSANAVFSAHRGHITVHAIANCSMKNDQKICSRVLRNLWHNGALKLKGQDHFLPCPALMIQGQKH